MKKIICGIIAITILITGIVCMPTISAATKTKEETNATLRAYTDDTLIGDIDNDGEITIDDATVGQQMIAQFLEFPVQRVKSISNITRPDQEIVIRVFDANCNGMIDIRDVTEIQQYLAEIQQGIYVTEKIYKKTVRQRYGSLPQYQGENVQDTTTPNTEPTTIAETEPTTTTPTQPVATEPTTIAPTEPTTVHVPVIQTTMKETVVENAYTFKAGGEWVQHVFCKTCHKDLTIMYKEYCEEHPDYVSGLTGWAQMKHQHSEWMYSPITGKLIRVLVTCDGTIWHKDFGRPASSAEAKEKVGAVQEMVYIGGQEYTYPAIIKRTYTQTTDGVVTKVWAEQTAYPGLDEIVNGTYVETFVPVDP